MLPFETNGKIPTVHGSKASTMEGVALEKGMSRFIKAVQEGNVPEALSAWKTICALSDAD